MKKVLIIAAGGTICMTKQPDGSLAPACSIEEVFDLAPRAKEVADLSFVFVTDIDSTDMHPELWRTIAKTVAENYDAYDGFVIAHGTDTMAYTASALSFALQGLRKPVVLMGAQKPPYDIATDVVTNLINAIKVATMPLQEVVIVFATSILRGNRARKRSELELEAFYSPNAPELGHIAMAPELYTERLLVPKVDHLIFEPDFDNNIVVFELVPGLKPAYVDAVIASGCKGIIIKAFGPGNVPNENSPYSLIESIRAATAAGVPCLITSQCPLGSTRMQMYKVGYDALRAGAIPGYNMTTEAATAKLMWVLARTNDLRKIREYMNTDLAGEVTILKDGVQ